MATEPNKPKKRRRRWWQYSLRTLFVLLTVFGVWLAWVVHRASEQRKAVEWVENMGGVVRYDYEFDDEGHLIDDGKSPGPKWLVELVGVDYFQEVIGVDLPYTQVNDLTPLVGLKSLRHLGLYNTPVRNVTPLAELMSLEFLVLNSTQVDDPTPLAKLTGLQELYLANTPVSKEQVEKLQQALPNCDISWSPTSSDQTP